MVCVQGLLSTRCLFICLLVCAILFCTLCDGRAILYLDNAFFLVILISFVNCFTPNNFMTSLLFVGVWLGFMRLSGSFVSLYLG